MRHEDLLESLFEDRDFAEAYEDAQFAANLIAGLTALRKEKGLTQGQLAELMEIGQPAVSEFENSTDHYLSTVMRYARALGKRVEFDLTHRRPCTLSPLATARLSSQVESTVAIAWDSLATDSPCENEILLAG